MFLCLGQPGTGHGYRNQSRARSGWNFTSETIIIFTVIPCQINRNKKYHFPVSYWETKVYLTFALKSKISLKIFPTTLHDCCSRVCDMWPKLSMFVNSRDLLSMSWTNNTSDSQDSVPGYSLISQVWWQLYHGCTLPCAVLNIIDGI